MCRITFNNFVFLQGSEWPLDSFCELLATDLFSPAWEVRHGAATGLRQIIKVHGRGGGKATYHTKEQVSVTAYILKDSDPVILHCCIVRILW